MTRHFRETPDAIIFSFTTTKIADEAEIQEIAESLRKALQRAAASGKRLIADFPGLQFMSSAMIGALVRLNKLAQRDSVDFRLANIRGNVHEAFKIARLDRVFRFENDDPESLGSGAPLPD